MLLHVIPERLRSGPSVCECLLRHFITGEPYGASLSTKLSAHTRASEAVGEVGATHFNINYVELESRPGLERQI